MDGLQKMTEARNEDCILCENASQIEWRLEQMEASVAAITKIMWVGAGSSISTLVGVIIILVTAQRGLNTISL